MRLKLWPLRRGIWRDPQHIRATSEELAGPGEPRQSKYNVGLGDGHREGGMG